MTPATLTPDTAAGTLDLERCFGKGLTTFPVAEIRGVVEAAMVGDKLVIDRDRKPSAGGQLVIDFGPGPTIAKCVHHEGELWGVVRKGDGKDGWSPLRASVRVLGVVVGLVRTY